MADFLAPSIANAFVDIHGSALPQMKLHKLSYMAHGWNLVINREPLIREQPEAWDNGPVYRRIWDRIRDFGLDRNGRILRADGRPFVADLSKDEEGVIEHVWNKYKKHDQYKLSAMNHEPGTPWTKTYFGVGRNEEIPNRLIAEHYRELALAGRQRSA